MPKSTYHFGDAPCTVRVNGYKMFLSNANVELGVISRIGKGVQSLEFTALDDTVHDVFGVEFRKLVNDIATDAPLVLEADALARIAGLEGEIAKRDARIDELESRYQRDVYGLNNEGDPIGGDPAGGYANDNARLRAELAEIKAQEPVAWRYKERADDQRSAWLYVKKRMHIPGGHKFEALYAAPVSEAKAQGVVMPEPMKRGDEGGSGEYGAAMIRGYNACLREVARLNAAPAAPAADAGHVFYGMDGNHP